MEVGRLKGMIKTIKNNRLCALVDLRGSLAGTPGRIRRIYLTLRFICNSVGVVGQSTRKVTRSAITLQAADKVVIQFPNDDFPPSCASRDQESHRL